MPTIPDSETQHTTSRPLQTPVPDGKSDLPITLPDYPPPTSDPAGDSGSTTGK